jgi:transposase
MTTMPQPVPTQVTVGVDTHADVHVAVAKDAFGRRLDATSVPTTPAGYAELLGWARCLGQPDAWGIEGTGSFGAGLARFLRAEDQVVLRSTVPTAKRGAGGASPTRSMPRPRPGRSRRGRAASPRPAMGRWR